MKHSRSALPLLLVVALLAITSCSSGGGGFEPIVIDVSKKPPEGTPPAGPPPTPAAAEGYVPSAEPAKAPPAQPAKARASVPPELKKMSLEERVGQLFVVSGHGIFLNDAAAAWKELARQVTENHVGGIVWFRSEVYETAVLNQKLQKLAKVPLLFSADLEAGSGMRFDDLLWGPWAMAVAATGDAALEERRAKATAEEARALGVGQIYAPVADVNVNPDNPVINVRSFGEDPQEVARFVSASVKGFQEGGVLATLKHFPGHGDTAVDSHRALPVLSAGRERLDAVELVPFRAGLEAGARSVMVGHIALPSIDPTLAPPLRPMPADAEYQSAPSEVTAQATMPASLSPPVVTELLRNQLGFSGLVVTDAMKMNGVAAYFDPGEAAVRAILAGDDMILASPDTDAAIKAVLAAVKAGRISMKRIDEAVERILAEKKRLGLPGPAGPDLAAISRTVGSPGHDALEEEIARRSLTLVRLQDGVLPLKKETKLLSLVVADEPTLKGPAEALTTDLKSRVPAVRTVLLDPRSTPDDVKIAVAASTETDVVLLSLFVRARSGQGPIAVPQPALVAIPQVLTTGKPVIAVAFGSPYLLRDFPGLKTYVCAWGAQEVMQKAAAAALFGEAAFGGRLPVTIPGLARRGDGITTKAK
ncbi:MAG: glycoside hydrolase family 3 protein [Acidithiobacillales bacterium]